MRPIRYLMRHVVIGLGEVGAALQQILECAGHDPGKKIFTEGEFDYMHVCIPYSKDFNWQVRAYAHHYNAKKIIIHSTVPIGTSKKLNALHSPIRGKHPNLAHSIVTFTKYVAGPGAAEVCAEFKTFGITALALANQDDTEAGKLMDLMQYGISILLNKEIAAFCRQHKLNFEVVYTLFNQGYNAGWEHMRHPEYVRPILKFVPGPIGGHCVAQMMELLDCQSAKYILEANKLLKEKFNDPN